MDRAVLLRGSGPADLDGEDRFVNWLSQALHAIGQSEEVEQISRAAYERLLTCITEE